MFIIFNKIQLINKGVCRPISLYASSLTKDNKHWRTLWENPNSFGPLTNLPDYTYMDGRPTPLGSNLKKRLDKQKEVAEKIVTLNKELKFAKERYARIQHEKSEELVERKGRQLKPKGHLLNQSN